MRKIIKVSRNRNDTLMWFVVHDSDRNRYEVWRTGPADTDMEIARERIFDYQGAAHSNDEVAARIQAKHLARDLSDAA